MRPEKYSPVQAMNLNTCSFISSGKAVRTGAVSKLSTESNRILFNPLINPSQSVEALFSLVLVNVNGI